MGPVRKLEVYLTRIPDLLAILLEIALGQNELAAAYSISIISILLSNFNLEGESDKLEEWTSKYISGAVAQLKKFQEGERARLGVVGFKFVESFNLLLKVGSFHLLLAGSQEIFGILLGLVKKHPLNNIFHGEVFKFLTTCLNSQTKLSAGVTVQ